MTDADLAATVDAAWEAREGLSPATKGAYRDAVEAALGLDRAERRLDAELRQCRRLGRQRHDGRHLGDGRLLRPDRQELSLVGWRRHRRRARAAAGRAGDHRG